MKVRYTVLLVTLLGFDEGSASGQSSGTSLTISATPLQKEYCRGDSDLAWLRVRSQVEITNHTKGRTLSLNKQDLHVNSIQVAKQIEDSSTKPYQVNISQTWIVGPSASLDHLDPALFLTLKPGRSVLTEISFSVPVSVQAGKDVSGTVPPGKYLVVLGVSGWQGSEDLASKVEAKLKELGNIWQGTIRSLPMSLSVEFPTQIESCK